MMAIVSPGFNAVAFCISNFNFLQTLVFSVSMQKTSFIDHHAHVYGTGYKVIHPKLDNANSIEEVLTILRPQLEHLTLNTPNWLSARGWDQNKWREKTFPTREHLDALSTEIPIALIRID